MVIRLATIATLTLASLAANAADEVKLVHARTSDCPPVSGCFRSIFSEGIVEVKNLAPSKQVVVSYKAFGSSTWQNASAVYFTPSNNGKELWKFSLGIVPEQFAIKYVVNGQTYWDNNGGSNINYRPTQYNISAFLTYPKVSDVKGMRSGATLSGDVLLKNLSYNKIVKIRYTDDNWASYKDGYATFQYTYPTGVELWNFSVPVNAAAPDANIKMAVEYTYTGGVDWDSNYGKNYKVVSGAISR